MPAPQSRTAPRFWRTKILQCIVTDDLDRGKSHLLVSIKEGCWHNAQERESDSTMPYLFWEDLLLCPRCRDNPASMQNKEREKASKWEQRQRMEAAKRILNKGKSQMMSHEMDRLFASEMDLLLAFGFPFNVGNDPPPNTSHQNGLNERSHLTIGDAIRTILGGAGLPPEFWPYAFHYISNVLLRSAYRVVYPCPTL